MTDHAGSRGEKLVEVLRAFGLIALIDSAGAVIAAILWLVHSAIVVNGNAFSVECLVGGAVVGHLLNVVIVPALWWKDLRIALPLTLCPITVAGALMAAFIDIVPAAILTVLGSIGWVIVVALMLPRTREVIRIGMCGFCGYSLHGNRSGRCPECGASLSRDAVAYAAGPHSEPATSHPAQQAGKLE